LYYSVDSDIFGISLGKEGAANVTALDYRHGTLLHDINHRNVSFSPKYHLKYLFDRFTELYLVSRIQHTPLSKFWLDAQLQTLK
jgi:hypothetical protein